MRRTDVFRNLNTIQSWNCTQKEKCEVKIRGPFEGSLLVRQVYLGKILPAVTISVDLRRRFPLVTVTSGREHSKDQDLAQRSALQGLGMRVSASMIKVLVSVVRES